MQYLVIVGIIVLIIYLIKKKPKLSVQTKAVIFLLICAAIFAIISIFAFEEFCGIIWKGSLIMAALVFLYSLFIKMFGNKKVSNNQSYNNDDINNGEEK